MNTAFDLTVNALREQGLNSDEILEELSMLFQKMAETSNTPNPTEVLEEKVISVLKKVGVPIHVNGFEYWKEAIICYKETADRYMEEIYKKVASICKTTPSKVEKAMRYSAEYAFKKCKKEEIEAIFGSSIYVDAKKISNKKFLCILVEQI